MVQPPDGFAWPRAAVTYFDGARTSSTQKPDGPETTSISRAPAPPVRPSVRASTSTPIRLRHRQATTSFRCFVAKAGYDPQPGRSPTRPGSAPFLQRPPAYAVSRTPLPTTSTTPQGI